MSSSVIKDNARPLLGLESCLALELIRLDGKVEQIGPNINEVQQKPTILNEFQDVFEGLGCVDSEYTIKLKVNSQPTIQPQRNVPLRLRDKLKATLDDLERRHIITRVEEPVDWVSNLVIVEKANNTLKLCLDPPDLNQAIEREDFKTQVLKLFQTHSMVARFSQLLTCQTVTGTKSLQRSLHFCALLIHLLAGFGSEECHLVFHVQARLHKKWSRNISVIFQVRYHFLMILSLVVKVKKNMI